MTNKDQKMSAESLWFTKSILSSWAWQIRPCEPAASAPHLPSLWPFISYSHGLFSSVPPTVPLSMFFPLARGTHSASPSPTSSHNWGACPPLYPDSSFNSIQLSPLQWGLLGSSPSHAHNLHHPHHWHKSSRCSQDFPQLRLCASTAGEVGSIPDQGIKIPNAAQNGQKKRKWKQHMFYFLHLYFLLCFFFVSVCCLSGLFFNWDIIDIQHCTGFRCTT